MDTALKGLNLFCVFGLFLHSFLFYSFAPFVFVEVCRVKKRRARALHAVYYVLYHAVYTLDYF